MKFFLVALVCVLVITCLDFDILVLVWHYAGAFVLFWLLPVWISIYEF